MTQEGTTFTSTSEFGKADEIRRLCWLRVAVAWRHGTSIRIPIAPLGTMRFGVRVGERTRIIKLHGARNLRDVGGYSTTDGQRQTRWRTLYRSGSTHELHKTGQQWLINAGLRTVIDLRDSQEVGE